MEAESRIRRQPRVLWAERLQVERARVLRTTGDEWLAGHVAFCLEERLFRETRPHDCGSAWGDGHECVAVVLHEDDHRCACGARHPLRQRRH